ncbi:hypothetical protein [Clostridium tertium]|uniref:Hint module n=1 Tax=Clostridium tertium TaxID=1559 RepID=A0A6N3B424_9CLOT
MVDTEAAKYFITNNLMPILRELDGEIEDLEGLKRKLGSLNRYYSRNSNMLSDINSALREVNGDYDKLQDFIRNFKSFIENIEEVDESLAKKFKNDVKEYCNTNGIETTEWYDTLLNFVQGALDIVGFIPVVGDIADLVNAVISAFRGDWLAVGISLIAIIPLVGDSFKFLKYTDEAAALLKYGDEVVDIGGAISKEGAQKASKKAGKEFTEKAIKDPDAAKKMLDTTMDMGNGNHYIKNKKGYDFEFDINKTDIHPESREFIMAGCFLGETKVKTENGLTLIRDIKAGDKVLTVNEKNGQEEYKEVKELFIRSSNEICIIKVGNDIIKTTTGHLFKVKDKWWTAAINIEKGDYLYSENNEYLEVDEVHVEKNNYPSYVYNLSIDGNHNYFVGEEKVLAHNMANIKSCSQPIEGVSTPESIPKRPSWRQSELDVQSDFPDYNPQKSFIDGDEVPYGTKGSSRPDFYKEGASIEVKNYKVTTSEGRSRLINNISNQVNKRITDLPSGTSQTIIIDVRGQNVSNDVLRSIRDKILEKSNVNVNIQFKR